jgi:hypothetical protein
MPNLRAKLWSDAARRRRSALHTSAGETTVSDNRRSSARHDVDLPASLVVNETTHETRIKNLSLGGAFIALEERLPMATRVQVTFSIPNQEQAIEVGGQVRWSTESGAGIQFDGLRARDVWSLNKYFEDLDT